MRVLVTGAAGFVGFHASKRFLEDGHEVFGVDNLSDYYDKNLKLTRKSELELFDKFWFSKVDLVDYEHLLSEVANFQPDIVLHLAAQAGVRYALEAPREYVSSNLIGTFNVLELVRELRPKHTLVASSSSVYGGNAVQPYAEVDRTDFPMSFYGATKKATEDMSHSYSHLYDLPVTCFRFFTVYGPWGRPDMALFKFTELISSGQPIEVYGDGLMKRDFTYVDDLIEAISRLTSAVPRAGEYSLSPSGDSISPVAPWRSVNISGGRPVELRTFIEVLEQVMGTTAQKVFKARPNGDVPETFADYRLLESLTGFRPGTRLEDGISEFVDWHSRYKASKDASRRLEANIHGS
ncbi:NAD-dependent epimerase/dehydratase family protein [Nesterenkonia sp. YGD6]|uniref:NAD-dependent epimerase/dehydratase family protein n=1 Tax=Nesterenkonia sp. YGD6 TaxID=2901231 RepID=UPI001F4CDFAD|nr:NAD-dependent epimerase/dehydratase family protein [Nesterenkonia sp. YGD6]MCH8563292.1 NAD-dependent epimerase/dehydratase family protein [Nesterenkonia sp. YGD6]